MKNNTQNNQQYESTTEDRDDRLVMQGTVVEAMPSTLFRVETSNGLMVLATLAGKLRLNRIRILPGDVVTVEVSPYDVTRGRITWRGR